MNHKLNIISWNVNHRGNRGRGQIPLWIQDEICGADIIVLTEFPCQCLERDAFLGSLADHGYRFAVSENPAGNDVLVAVKSSYPILRCSWVPCYGVDGIPENLRVDIRCEETILTIFGVRIKALGGDRQKSQKRRAELQWVLKQVEDVDHPIVITGDFNSNRRETVDKIWSMDAMKSMLKGYTLYTPEGSSVFEETPWKAPSHEFPYDHFAVKNAGIANPTYDRDFTERHPQIYTLHRDFREPWYPGAQEKGLRAIDAPYPDHAILKGTLILN